MLTCGTWVKRGIAKELPDKVSLTEEDLNTLLKGTEEKIRDLEENENFDAESELQRKSEEMDDKSDECIDGDDDDDIIKHYGLNDYDDDGGTLMTGAGMAGLMYYTSEKDPYVDLKALNEDELIDFAIKKDDNLFVVGKMEEDCSCLDVYVYNEIEDSLYVHHDILLESFPLCLEWLSFDPTSATKSGNFVAVGTMEPDIDVWDLDIVNTIEPVFTLMGDKKNKKENTSAGHRDAVLCLSWNPNAINVFASGSADKSVILWDLSKCIPVRKLTHHTDKVQAAKWHPQEAKTLLTGSFDKSAAVLDCRSPKAFKSWKLSGECEQVLWDHFSPFNFLVSSDDGVVAYFDVRNESPVFTLNAHDQAVTGISLSNQEAHCLTTVSSDKFLKVWDFHGNKPMCVLSRDMKMGSLHFTTNCPDASLIVAVGGDKDGVRVLDILGTTQGKQYFNNSDKASKGNMQQNTHNFDEEKAEIADSTTNAAEALLSLSLKTESTNQDSTIVKRKKKKKKTK